MSLPSRPLRTGRKLNITLIKQVIVMLTGVVTAAGSVITGIGANVAYGPMLIWMLGFAADKAQATATRFATIAAAAGVITYYVYHPMPSGYFGRALLLAFGMTVGALIGARFKPDLNNKTRYRIGNLIGVAVGMAILIRTVRLTIWEAPHFAGWSSLGAMLALGLAVGVLTQATTLASGVILVPALYYLSGMKGQEVVTLAILSIGLVSLLPVLAYSSRGLIDNVYGRFADIGGVLGGAAGGALVGVMADRWILTCFAIAAMFLSARQLARIATT